MRLGNALHVLIVDGAGMQLETERTFLRRGEFAVLQAPQGGAALEAARTERPELVVIDVGEAGRGLATCRAIKADAQTRGLPVVLVGPRTARPDAEGAGADAFLAKPVVQREFLEAVRRFVPVAVRRARRQVVNVRFGWAFEGTRGSALSRELSPRGVFLKCDRDFPVGARLTLRFRIPEESDDVVCGGVVRNVDVPGRGAPLGPGVGLEFDALEDDDARRLASWLDREARRPAVPA